MQRLSGERQHPETGRVFQSEKLNAVNAPKKINNTEEDEEPEELDEEVLEDKCIN